MTEDHDRWTLAMEDVEKKKLIYRIRRTVPEFACKTKFFRLFLTLWEYVPANEVGLPDSDDAARMLEVEHQLKAAFEGQKEGFLAVVVTGDGVREWQWYVRNWDVAMALVDKTLSSEEAFAVVHYSPQEEDRDWSVYEKYLKVAERPSRSID